MKCIRYWFTKSHVFKTYNLSVAFWMSYIIVATQVVFASLIKEEVNSIEENASEKEKEQEGSKLQDIS